MNILLWFEQHLRWTHSDYFELFRLMLELAAVVLGVQAYFDIRRQLSSADGFAKNLTTLSTTVSGRFETVADNLESIYDSLSTRFIGHFPANFTHIMQVLGRAKKSVRIMVDYADYGSLTAHKEFLTYLALVNELGGNPDVDVRMISYTLEEAFTNIKLDFGTEDKLKTYTKENAIRSILKRKQAKSLPTPEVFMAWLLEDQISTEANLRKNGVSLVMYSHLPLFCWICDDEEAVFSFPLHEDPKDYPKGAEPFRSSEISFFTREDKIVKALCQTFDELYLKARIQENSPTNLPILRAQVPPLSGSLPP